MALVQFNASRPDLSRNVGLYFGVVIFANLFASEAAFLSFGWPEFLRSPPAQILESINQGSDHVYLSYYLWVLAWIAFVAVPVLTWSTACRSASVIALVAIPFGCLAGLCHAIGPGRWVFVVPALAADFARAGEDPVGQQAILTVFDALHRFAGIMIGEHFGNILKGIWTLLVSLSLVQSLPSYLRVGGFVAAAGSIAASLEQFGGPFSGLMPFLLVFQLVWIIWCAALAFELFRLKSS